MISNILSKLVYSANTCPLDKDWFYGIKSRILKRFGKRIAWDQQHIIKSCWSCDGTGIFRGFDNGYFYREVPPQHCYKCDGSGVYDEFWVLLEVWELGGYEFHRPVQRIRKGQYFIFPNKYTSIFCDFRNKIEGFIKHDSHKNSKVSFWFLAAIFTPIKITKYWGRKIHLKILRPWWKIKCRIKRWQIRNEDIPF